MKEYPFLLSHASPLQVTSLQSVRFPQQFGGTYLWWYLFKGSVRVKCLAQKHKSVPGQGFNLDCSISRQVHQPWGHHPKGKPENLFSSQSVSHRLSNSVLFWCHSSGSIRTQYPLPSTGSSIWKKTSWSRVKPFNSLIYNVCYVLIRHDFVFPKGLTHQHSLLGSTFFLLVVNYKHA